jgi:hypothetical protein
MTTTVHVSVYGITAGLNLKVSMCLVMRCRGLKLSHFSYLCVWLADKRKDIITV